MGAAGGAVGAGGGAESSIWWVWGSAGAGVDEAWGAGADAGAAGAVSTGEMSFAEASAAGTPGDALADDALADDELAFACAAPDGAAFGWTVAEDFLSAAV